tara:strand:- start:774 stop:2813 length:2040 start_codon:yes stop_codon:yes gene_type:complete
LVGGIYSQTLNHELVNYDDRGYILHSEASKGITLKGIKWAFTTHHMSNWHPVTWFSHMVDVQLYGTDPGGHHGTSMALHALNAVVFFLLLCSLTRSLWPSLFAAALFAVHPLAVEPVAWIAGRKHLLSTLFWFLTTWAYVRHARRPSLRWYGLALLLFAIGLGAKAMLVTLPCVLLLLDYWPLRRHEAGAKFTRLAIEKLPFFGVTILSSVVTYFALRTGAPAESSVTGDPITFADRLCNIPVLYAAHLKKLVWPFDLGLNYAHPSAWPAPAVFASLCLLAGITVLILQRVRKAPFLLVGWLWWLGTMVPVIGLVQDGRNAGADRYDYVPLLGLFIAISWWLWKVLQERGGPKVFGCLGAVVVLALAGRAYDQAKYWRNSEALFGRIVDVAPDYPHGHFYLGGEYLAQDRLLEAELEFKEAIRVAKQFPAAHLGLQLVYTRMGKLDLAAEHGRLGIPGVVVNKNVAADLRLAAGLASKGKHKAAATTYLMALQRNPGQEQLLEARRGLGIALTKVNRTRDALPHLEYAKKQGANDFELYVSLTTCLARAKRYDEALRASAEALKLQPDSVRARHNLGMLYAFTKQPNEAITQFQAVLEADPNQVATHYALGKVLFEEKRQTESIRHLLEVLKLKPGFPPAQKLLRQMGVGGPRKPKGPAGPKPGPRASPVGGSSPNEGG